MSNWFDVAPAAEFSPGTWRTLEADNINIVVFNLDGEFFALENVCTHDGGELAGGPILGDEVVCPRHGARFCIKTGAVTAPPAYEDIRTFTVRVQDGMVQIEITA